MRVLKGIRHAGRAALVSLAAFAMSACSMFGGSEPETAATAQAAPGAEIDVRRYLGSGYCPEIRIREGTEMERSYERGHEDDPAHVVWQASVGKTARECLYDQTGNLIVKVGVSGRVVAGPRGGPQTVLLPLRIAVVKHKEAVLASELYPLSIAIPPGNSTVFSEVRELQVPSPGDDRDYIIYVGFDEKGENLLDPAAGRIAAVPEAEDEEPEVVEIEEPPPARRAAQPPPPAQPAQPNVLPVPSEFVLPSG
jgi:hypothetical protein